MRGFLFFYCILTLIWSCKSNNCCGGRNKYLIKVDTSKPYRVKGKYCITIHDTIVGNNMSIISVKGFDRKTGKSIKEGVVWIENGIDTLRLLIDNGSGYKKLPVGSYAITLLSLDDDDLLGLMAKGIELRKNTKMEINFYLGSSMQW